MDTEELDKLFASENVANQQLLAEIVEEEKIIEIVAKEDELKEAERK